VPELELVLDVLLVLDVPLVLDVEPLVLDALLVLEDDPEDPLFDVELVLDEDPLDPVEPDPPVPDPPTLEVSPLPPSPSNDDPWAQATAAITVPSHTGTTHRFTEVSCSRRGSDDITTGPRPVRDVRGKRGCHRLPEAGGARRSRAEAAARGREQRDDGGGVEE
jgi:hypothetical protein